MTIRTAVIKLGSSVLATDAEITQAVHEVYRYLRNGYKVLVVISAIGNTTDKLEARAKQLINDSTVEPDHHAFAELLATGETIAASLFAIALNNAGIPAKKLNHDCLQTVGPVLDAEPHKLRKNRILKLFEQYPVLVLPGFIGLSKEKSVTLLGRGGSDFTAVYVAWSLAADECVLYKDTNGIYTQDPEKYGYTVLRYKMLSYADCLKISYAVIQHKAIKFAQERHFNFTVKKLNCQDGTLIGGESTLYPHSSRLTQSKLKVALFGLGTVGYGLYQNLLATSEHFEIIGIGVKNLNKHLDIPSTLISDDYQTILARDCDIVIELIGDPLIAERLITQALAQGRHVVTANKFLLAEKGLQLNQFANAHGVKLLYSAAVAGSVPILETLACLAKKNIKSITGILNGTCNYILEKVSLGESLTDAIQAAQTAGFAEADPTLDISGIDAAQKLTIIARHAFGKELKHFEIQGIQDIDATLVAEHAKNNQIIKLLAHVKYDQGILHASVKPQAIPNTDFLAKIDGANNAILIETAEGEYFHIHGKGAGRWPTAEAVYADLLDLALARQGLLHNDLTLDKDLRRIAV